MLRRVTVNMTLRTHYLPSQTDIIEAANLAPSVELLIPVHQRQYAGTLREPARS